jgi:hypothetical protein
MKTARTIDEVITQLQDIVDETVAENNYLGIFAYVYLRTTEGVKEAIDAGRFEDNARMERMDVDFANYYIQAYHNYKHKKEVSSSWAASFDAKNERLTLIQHLLMGMNAHINLDLGQAAAATAPGAAIHLLKNDFMEINKVLGELTDVMQRKLGKVSPLMFLLDWVGQRTDEVVVNFSMVKAREQSWRLAEELALKETEAERKERVQQADENITFLSKIIKNPPGRLLPFFLSVIGALEEKNVDKIIGQMRDGGSRR